MGPDVPAPVEIAQSLRRWAVEKALPLWSTNGFDKKRGGFHERLNPDGSPDLSANRRLRVQARQVYVFAQAADLGWFPGARNLAIDGAAYMIERYRAADGKPGYVSALAPDKSVANALRDTYDHMFVLLALAWAAKVSNDAQMRARLDETLAFVDEHLTAGDGSFVEGLPASLPRRQNPHMHAFEAMLALHETIAHPQAMARAARLLSLMKEKFFDARTSTIGEYFTDAWTKAPGADGDLIEPGHLVEWAWLLRQHERINKSPPAALSTALLQSALQWTDAKTGFLIDEADRNGAARRTSRRTWPQTELAKAWIAEAEIGKPGAAEKAAHVLQALRDHYLDRPVVGGWTDQFDADGQPLTTHMPASTLYHVFCAITEADRVLARGSQ